MEGEYFYYEDFIKEMNTVIDLCENGTVPEAKMIEKAIEAAHKALRYAEYERVEVREDMKLTIDAFFRGYLGLSKEAMLLFAPKEDGSYDYEVNSILKEIAVKADLEHLKEEKQ